MVHIPTMAGIVCFHAQRLTLGPYAGEPQEEHQGQRTSEEFRAAFWDSLLKTSQNL